MKLSIEQRLLMSQVVQELQSGSFDLIKEKKKLMAEILFNDEEMEKFDIKQEDGAVKWNNEKAEEKDIDLTPYKEVIEKGHDAFKAVHENKQDWTDQLVAMAEAFEASFLSTDEDKTVDGTLDESSE